MTRIEKRNPKRVSVFYPLPNTRDSGETQEQRNNKRVAAYCRVSSGSSEQLESYNAQIQYYERYIKDNPDYISAGIYADEAVSGTDTRKRDAFRQMVQDCRDGKIDVVVTKSLSRFGRNTVDCLKVIRELKVIGIDVFFEKENIHTLRSEGEMLIALISAVAQNESLTLSENVKWGIHRKYERGLVQSIPCGKFLGYDKDKYGNLEINEEQAAIVRRIYKEFLDGYGTYQIAKRLTEEKIPMVYGGKEWCASHIRKVLTNEKMKGATLCQKTYIKDYLTKKRAKNIGVLPQYYYENTHPAIIEKEIWECVQLEFERQKKYCMDHKISTFHRNNPENLLSAKIICSVCGSTFILLESKRVGEEGRKYWRCRSFHGNNGTEVKSKIFTPKPLHSTSQNTKVIRRWKDPEPRQMLCTDVQVEEGMPEKAFITVWNRMVDNYGEYLPVWKEVIEGTNVLRAYRAKEMMSLVRNTKYIKEMSYELMIKTLSHFEVGYDDTIKVIYLVGVTIEIVVNIS